jgi:NADPH:quinone reductase
MIVGGAGSVAHYAIQLAKMRGARVITTVSGPNKAAHALKAGADEVINYRTENVGQRVKSLTDGQGVDAVIELDLSANCHGQVQCTPAATPSERIRDHKFFLAH